MKAGLPRRALLAACIASPVAAQEARPWPDRAVRLVNSGAPGSGIDLMARLLAEALAARFGQPFPVENRPGAGSVLAAQAHATARAGESLLLGATGIVSTVPFTFQGRLPFDPEADLVPLCVPGSEFLCLAVHGGLAATDLAALWREAAARPGALNWYSVPGYAELDARLFLHRRGLDTTFVAYPGSPAAVLDLAAGRLHFAVLPLTPALPAIRDGRIRALAVTSSGRAPSLPDVPTVSEAGSPELRYDPFTALFGWRGMGGTERERVVAAVAAAVAEPAAAARLAQAGIQARFADTRALAAVIAEQRAKVQEALRVVGLRQA